MNSLGQLIKQAKARAEELQRLVSEDRSYVVKSERDPICLGYWTLFFEHHYSILLLAEHRMNASAFALLRPFEEAFFRMFLTMYGTQNQFEAIRDGKYELDFTDAAKRLSTHLGLQCTTLEDIYKIRKGRLHGFTHGGREQLYRFLAGRDIVSNFTEEELGTTVEGTMFQIHLAAKLVTAFLGLANENAFASAAFEQFTKDVVQAGAA
jgi:hypothetical protein